MKPYIPQPCHEDWDTMSKKDKGRHCDVCAKVVVDFTKMNDEDIIDFFQQHQQQKTCGHFRNEQLYQPEKLEINLSAIPANLSFRKYFAIALLIAFTSFGLVSCKSNAGRTVGEIEVVDSAHIVKQDSLPELTGAVAPVPPKQFTEGEVCIKPKDSTAIKSQQHVNQKELEQYTVKGEVENKPTKQNDSVEPKTMGKPVLPKQK